jgi:ABC-type glutathione transport system ATPase component
VTVLELADVTVVRGARRLLEDVSLTVGAGEAVGLVGASGAGKSTLVRAALALERPLSGTVRWGSVNPWALQASAMRRARREIAVVLQQPAGSLDPRRSVADSVAEPLMTHEWTLSASQRDERVAATLARVGLDPAIGARRPGGLSGGEAQRVCIARALIAQPSLLLLDEPTSALDASAAAGVLLLLRALKRDGVALLMVSHDLPALGTVANRLVVLDAGRVVETGSMDQCMAMPSSAALAALVRTAFAPM